MPILSSFGTLKRLPSFVFVQPYYATFLNAYYCVFNTASLSPGLNDYSIEFFLSQTSTPSSGAVDPIFDGGYQANIGGIQIVVNSSRNIRASFGDGSGVPFVMTSSSSVDTGTWYYIAISRVSGTTRMFINTTEVASSTSITASLSFPNNQFGKGITTNSTSYLFGDLASFRLNVGSGFTAATVPTSLLPVTAETKILTFQKSTLINEVNSTTATTNTGVYMSPGGPF